MKNNIESEKTRTKLRKIQLQQYPESVGNLVRNFVDSIECLLFGDEKNGEIPKSKWCVQSNRRLRVLNYWLRGKKNRVSLGELFSFMFGDFYDKKALKLIDEVKESDEYLIFSIKGIEKPLYYPKKYQSGHYTK